MKQEMMGGNGISWTTRKSAAHCSKQLSMPASHHLVLTSQMLFLTPSKQYQRLKAIHIVIRK